MSRSRTAVAGAVSFTARVLEPRRAAAGGALVLALICLSISGVLASHIDNIVPTANYDRACAEGNDYSGTVCQTDNAALSYYMDSYGDFMLENEDRYVVQDVMNSQYHPTDLSVALDASPTFSGSGETDIIYQEGSVPDTAVGVTWCNDASPSPVYECDQQYVKIQGGGWYNPGVTCHETGHAVGLTHGENASPLVSNSESALGCMRNPIGANEGSLFQNQIENINITY